MINREIQRGETAQVNPRETLQKAKGDAFLGSTIDTKDQFIHEKAENLPLIPGKLAAAAVSPVEVSSLRSIGDFSRTRELPRKMTEDEKADFKSWFPNLDVDKAVVTDEAMPEYNCISWTVGETRNWFWPPEMYPGVTEENAFDQFYASYGFKPAPQGEVARWRNDQGLTHGCVSGSEHGPAWESKCGAALRIQHDLNELESDVYGKADGYYKREGGAQPMPERKSVEIPLNVKTSIFKAVDRTDPQVREKFENLYAQWKDFRKSPDLQFSSKTSDYCKTKSFDEITGMGTAALPLLMEKMAKGDFFCLQAVDTITKKQSGIYKSLNKLQLSPDEIANSEQNKAALTLIKWFDISDK